MQRILQVMIGLVVSICLLGCQGNRLGYRTFERDIQSSDPGDRIRAIIYAANAGDRRTVPLIVDRLEDEDETVRMSAVEALKQITGRDYGYRSFDPPYVRAQAVERWRNWIAAQNTKPGTTQPINRNKAH